VKTTTVKERLARMIADTENELRDLKERAAMAEGDDEAVLLWREIHRAGCMANGYTEARADEIVSRYIRCETQPEEVAAIAVIREALAKARSEK
jgi:hypothetical protein